MGTSWISRKGRNLRKGGVDLEKGGMPPLTNYESAKKLSSYLVRAKLYPTEKSVGSYISVVENVVSSA